MWEPAGSEIDAIHTNNAPIADTLWESAFFEGVGGSLRTDPSWPWTPVVRLRPPLPPLRPTVPLLPAHDAPSSDLPLMVCCGRVSEVTRDQLCWWKCVPHPWVAVSRSLIPLRSPHGCALGSVCSRGPWRWHPFPVLRRLAFHRTKDQWFASTPAVHINRLSCSKLPPPFLCCWFSVLPGAEDVNQTIGECVRRARVAQQQWVDVQVCSASLRHGGGPSCLVAAVAVSLVVQCLYSGPSCSGRGACPQPLCPRPKDMDVGT